MSGKRQLGMHSPTGKVTEPWAACATGKNRAGLTNQSAQIIVSKFFPLVLVITFTHSVD